LKAGFKRYGGGRIPASYLPEKIDIKVPGGEFILRIPMADELCSAGEEDVVWRGVVEHGADLVSWDI
jgi:hypothetical protein